MYSGSRIGVFTGLHFYWETYVDLEWKTKSIQEDIRGNCYKTTHAVVKKIM